MAVKAVNLLANNSGELADYLGRAGRKGARSDESVAADAGNPDDGRHRLAMHGYVVPELRVKTGISHPAALIALMRDTGIPSSIRAVGFTEADLDPLVEGALTQRRLLAPAPKPPAPADLADHLVNPFSARPLG